MIILSRGQTLVAACLLLACYCTIIYPYWDDQHGFIVRLTPIAVKSVMNYLKPKHQKTIVEHRQFQCFPAFFFRLGFPPFRHHWNILEPWCPMASNVSGSLGDLNECGTQNSSVTWKNKACHFWKYIMQEWALYT